MLASLSGFIIAVLAGLANSSPRRLIVTGSVSLLITLLAFPLTTAVGSLSRETIRPTALALTPIFPAFLLPLLLVCACLALVYRGDRLSAGLAVAAGLGCIFTALLWAQQVARLVRLTPLYGLMEALTALLLAATISLLGWSLKRFRPYFIALGVLAGLALFLWFSAGPGHRYFPNAEGYYKLTTTTPAGTAERVVEDYNAGLEDLNAQRERIGLNLLEPINAIDGLEGGRIPRQAASEGLRLVTPSAPGYGNFALYLMAGLLIGAGVMQLRHKDLRDKGDLSSGLMLALVFCALTPAFSATDFSLQRLVNGWPFLQDFLDRSWPPDLGVLQQVASEMLITIEIALIGTFLAALFAVPLSFLAARNLTQGNAFMKTVFALTRAFFNVDRGIDTLILALVFVAAVGLGPFAGILAMAIHSIADLGKVYSESIENVDRGPIEALEAVGASGSNVVRWAILPQVGPLFIAWTLYRFEINFRVSIVLGLVGAGGIGFFIQEKMGSGAYDEMIIAIIAIILVVNIIDFASSYLRSRLA